MSTLTIKELKEIQEVLKKEGKDMSLEEIKKESILAEEEAKEEERKQAIKKSQIAQIIRIVQKALIKHKVKHRVIWDIGILVRSLESLSGTPNDLFETKVKK